MTTLSDTLYSSFLGLTRGLIVHTLIYPLDVLKTHLQLNPRARTFSILRTHNLFCGLSFEIAQKSLKQTWVWPVMTFSLSSLENTSLPLTIQRLLTALTLSTLDASLTTPFERGKILSRTQPFCWKNVYKDGWKTALPHWTKLSASWCTFLIAEAHLRTDSSPTEPILTGFKIALLVSLTSAPFDAYNTFSQTGRLHSLTFRSLYRGWHLRLLALTIHSIASVTCLDILRYKNKTLHCS